MRKGFTKSELKEIDTFITEAQSLPDENIRERLAPLRSVFSNKIGLLFWQLEQDIETVLKIPKDYLVQKVLNTDISEVLLEDLDKILFLVNSKKRYIYNTYYEYLFNSFKYTRLGKRDSIFIKEAEDRLALFFSFQNTIRDIVSLHIAVKKMFIIPKNREFFFQDITHLPDFEKEIEDKIQKAINQIKILKPAMRQLEPLQEEEYEELINLYLNELTQDDIRDQQIEYWEKEIKKNPSINKQLKILIKNNYLLQNANRKVIFIAYSSKQNINKLLSTLQKETATIENMIDNFRI